MQESMLDKICHEFKSKLNKDVKDLNLFTMETVVLKFVINLGKNMTNQLFKQYGTGYEGDKVKKKESNKVGFIRNIKILQRKVLIKFGESTRDIEERWYKIEEIEVIK